MNGLLMDKVEQQLYFDSSEFTKAELAGILTARQLDQIRAGRLFKMFVPEIFGGLNLSLPEVLHIEEALARQDGSLAWTVTLCAGAALFAGYLDDEVNGQFSLPEHACWGGSGAATGTARRCGDSFLVNGVWNYATGAPHCTAFTANCRMIDEEGEPLIDEHGEPLVRAFVFDRSEVELIFNWQSSGMVASASHGFRISEVYVPLNRSFYIDASGALRKEIIFQYPFLQLAESTLAVNLSGMAAHFLLEAGAIFERRQGVANVSARERRIVGDMLSDYGQRLNKESAEVHRLVAESWKALEGEEVIDPELMKGISVQCRKLRSLCLDLVHDVYPHCGIGASVASSTINRIWRDLHTASQHNLLLYPRE